MLSLIIVRAITTMSLDSEAPPPPLYVMMIIIMQIKVYNNHPSEL